MLYLEGYNFRSRREGAGRGKEERKVNMIVAAGSIWHMTGPGRREVQELGGCPSGRVAGHSSSTAIPGQYG